MRVKDFGVIGIVLFMISVIASGYLFYNARASVRLAPLPHLSEKAVSYSLVEQQAVQRLEMRLDDLAQPKEVSTVPVDLRIFGYDLAAVLAAREVRPEDLFRYKVSMAYISEDRKYGVVDGKFYSQGENLPDGGKIKKITNKGMLISRSGIQRWIGVSNPIIKPVNSWDTRKVVKKDNNGLNQGIEALEQLKRLQEQLQSRGANPTPIIF